MRDVLAPLGARPSIVGSGPSVRGQRVERLDGVVLLNGALSARDRVRGPVVIAVEDERFLWRHAEMRHLANPEDGWLMSTEAIRAMAEIDTDWLRTARVAHMDNLLKPYRAPRRTISDKALEPLILRGDDAALSLAPERGVVPAGTVAFSALQCVLSARPERVGLAGIDLSNAAEPRFYEAAERAEPSGIQRAEARILSHFALAARHAAAQGTGLECYSAVSSLLGVGIPYSDRLEPGKTD